MVLTPLPAVILFVVMVLCGRQFRENWKAQSAGWQRRAWFYAVPATLCFAALAFIPLEFA